MSDTTKRRWWHWVLLTTALLLVGVPIAWTFRPLNATELALIGRWRVVGDAWVGQFDANRRFTNSSPTESGETTGSWRAYGSCVYFRSDHDTSGIGLPWQDRLILSVQVLLNPPKLFLRFDGPDRLWMNEVEWVRVPD